MDESDLVALGVWTPGQKNATQNMLHRPTIGSYILASEIPTVTVGTGGAASAIPASYRICPAVKNSNPTQADHLNDPTFRIVGVPDGKMIAGPSGTIEGGLFTGATAGAATSYWMPFIETSWFGDQIEFRLRSKYTGTVYYRIYIDNKPVTDSFQSFSGASGTAYNILVSFASAGSRVIGIEFAFAQFGGVFVGPTASIARPKNDRKRIAFLGNSIMAGAGTVTRHNTWAGNAARLLGMECYNAAIGQTGFLALAPYEARVADIAPGNPDVIVVGDPYNDLGLSRAAVHAATQQTLDAIKVACPRAKVILLGCWSPSQTPSATNQAFDADQKAIAASYGIPFLSYRDPGDSMDSAPAWAPGENYAQGMRVTYGGIVWLCSVTHSAGASFATANFIACCLVTATNASAVLLGDGVHPTMDFHRALGALMARRISNMI